MPFPGVCRAAFVVLAAVPPLLAQGGALPQPTGKHAVGRTGYVWPASKGGRPDPRAADGKAVVAVRLWYPAARRGTVPGAYLPGHDRLKSGAAAAAFANLFGPAWAAITANAVKTHAYEEAPVAAGARLPVLLFSPGGGVPAVGYTAQLEELASHGYVVAAVEHPGEAEAVVLPDGRVVARWGGFWDRLRRETPEPERYEKRVTELEAADLAMVIDRLAGLDGERGSLFHGRLDMKRVGAFGHSRGGRNAARLCQIDKRVRACLNQDGNFSWHPFWLDEAGKAMAQPYMTLDHLDAELPAAVFTKMGTTRERYAERRSARQAEARAKLYGAIDGGAYHVTIRTPGISHNSFADIRLLGRADAGTINSWPAEVQATTPHERILRLITAFTRAFFDRSVRGMPEPLLTLAGRGMDADVEVRRYGAGAR